MTLSLDQEDGASRTKLIAAFAAIYLFWGGTFLALRYAVVEVPPLLTIAILCAGRALVAAVLVIGAVMLTRDPSPSRGEKT
ncbi:MAG TPA: hypothetical protein VKK31_18145 [Thermoanaerobaculia bacterium]|nr:hypothetical protein [Thermoanaerobaculia bacterium]